MAEGKNSFVLYKDIIETVKKLPPEKQGKLFMTILEYVNDENPEIDDIVIDLVFTPIKQSLNRDLQKYEAVCHRNKNNGKKGGRPKKEKPNKPTGLIENPKKPKKADSDSDSDNESDIDIDNDTFYNIEKLKKVYLKDELLTKAIISNKENRINDLQHLEKRLEEFNTICFETGKKLRTWPDYTSHFRNWNKLKKEVNKKSSPTQNIAF